MVSFSDWKKKFIEYVKPDHVTNNHVVFGLALLKNWGCVSSINRLHGQIFVPSVYCDLVEIEHQYAWSFLNTNYFLNAGNPFENIPNTAIKLMVGKATALRTRLECIGGLSTLMFLKFDSLLVHLFNRSSLSICHALNSLMYIRWLQVRCQ